MTTLDAVRLPNFVSAHPLRHKATRKNDLILTGSVIVLISRLATRFALKPMFYPFSLGIIVRIQAREQLARRADGHQLAAPPSSPYSFAILTIIRRKASNLYHQWVESRRGGVSLPARGRAGSPTRRRDTRAWRLPGFAAAGLPRSSAAQRSRSRPPSSRSW